MHKCSFARVWSEALGGIPQGDHLSEQWIPGIYYQSLPPQYGNTSTHHHNLFYEGTGELNSSPTACVASSLQTEFSI